MQNVKQIVDHLEHSLTLNYDVERRVMVNGCDLELLARSRTSLQHYAITRKIVVDESKIDDYVAVAVETKPATAEVVERHFEWLTQWAEKTVRSDERHMKSRFVAVLLLRSNWLPHDFESLVKRYRKIRWFRFGLHGWMEMSLVCYHLDSGRAYYNKTTFEFGELLEKIGEIMPV